MQKSFFKNQFFVGILKVNDENRRIRIRIRIRQSKAWIRGSGSTPKCHGSATLLLSQLMLSFCGTHPFYFYGEQEELQKNVKPPRSIRLCHRRPNPTLDTIPYMLEPGFVSLLPQFHCFYFIFQILGILMRFFSKKSH